jgi:type IV pilus assembly protein PilQ
MKILAHFPSVSVQYAAWCLIAVLMAFGINVRADGVLTSNSVVSVDSSALPGGKFIVRVGLKHALRNVPAGFSVGNPPRIALDLPDTGNGVGKNTVEANLGPLSTVNVIQAGNRTRLVLNLNKSVAYEAKIDGNYLLVSLGDNSRPIDTPVNASQQFSEAAPATSGHAIRDIEFRRGPNGEGRIVTTLADAQTGINIHQQSKGVTVDFFDTELPKALQRRLDVADFATPVSIVESYPLGGSTRMVIEPHGEWEYSAYQTDNQFIVEVKPSTDGVKRTADGKVKYTGEKLSLNFQNVEVRSVLQVIADFTGLNIVASDTVTGNLTLRLKDVPWDQALDLIMQTKGLDKRANGNVIWIAPKDELLTKEKLEFEAKSAVDDLEPLITEYISLNYMRADEAQSMLNGSVGRAATGAVNSTVNCTAQAEGLTSAATTQAAAQTGGVTDQKILTKRGRSTYDLKTNTLIITDTARKIQEVRELLARLDVPARQVMIEARVVVADSDWSRDLGAKLTFNGLGGINNITGRPLRLNGTGTGQDLPVPTSGSAANLTLSLLNAANTNVLGLEIAALEAESRGKILSNPRVMTTNQKPAVILNGTQLPYVTPGTANTPATVTFKDVFLCLLVDPQILNNDSLIMTVEVQKDAIDTTDSVSLGPNGGFAPAIATKRVKTQVRVNNGDTLVLGGIFDETATSNLSKVPFLGDIPVLGNIFKTTSRSDAKEELLIFLTPRILDDRLSLR